MAPKMALALMCIVSTFACVLCGFNQGFGVGHGGAGYGNGQNADFYSKPYYRYSYGVNDHKTGDVKHASEHRDGDNVQGEYALMEPDGAWRTVTYVADHNGFRANVQRSPGQHGYGGGHGGY